MKYTEPYLKVLETLNNIRFQIGTKLFIEVLLGDETTRIIKLNLNKTRGFGCLADMTSKQVGELLEVMKFNKLIEIQSLLSNKFIKVLKITNKGLNELVVPQLFLSTKKGLLKYFDKIEVVTEQDKRNFSLLESFLSGLNDEQKKAIIIDSPKILCIAGAGTGKTSVLIKRIEYLARYKSIDQGKILAITFTRKARQEMQQRLEKTLPNHNVKIETFNSFSEKILRKYEKEIYSGECRVADLRLQAKMFLAALKKLSITNDDAITTYFSNNKITKNDKTTLLYSLVSDVFAINDYYLNRNESFEEINKRIDDFSLKDRKKAVFVYKILKIVNKLKQENNIRGYTEQIIHTIDFFKNNKNRIPKYEHILIDEYQDINDLQIELIGVLNPENLFVVGDPRQSIYEWRNAKIEHILGFSAKYENAKIIQLRTNYRSTQQIIDLANRIIDPLKLPNLITHNKEKQDSIAIIKHESENAERIFLLHSILAQDVDRNKIFVLTRTNRQLDDIADFFKKNKLKFLKKSSDLENNSRMPEKDEVVLSTVHAIKGLEAEIVFIAGANSINFPCKASEHPVLEMIKSEDPYNKESEELRLFYVAITRVKTKLVISYSGNITKFIPREYLENNFPAHLQNKSLNQYIKKDLYSDLREWRRETAKLFHVPAFQILSDRVLLQIAKLKPKDFVELEAIPGIGPAKLNKFGDDILDVVG